MKTKNESAPGHTSKPETFESLVFSKLEVAEKIEMWLDSHSTKLKAVTEKLPTNSPELREAQGLLQEFNRTMGKKVRALALTLSVISPLLAAEETSAGNEFTSIHSEEVTAGLEDLRSKIWTDKHETAQIFLGVSGEEEAVLRFTGDVGSATASSSAQEQEIGSQKMLKIQKEHVEEDGKLLQITQHNHPPYVISKELGFNIENLKESGTVVLPPSIVDLFSTPHLNEKIDYIGYVEEPSGTWKFDPDESHPLNEVIREERMHLISEMMDSSKNGTYTIPLNLSGLVQQYSQMEDRIEEVSEVSYTDGIQTISGIAQEIRLKSIAGEDVSGLIDQYIEIAGGLGIRVEYHPHTAN